MLQIREKTIRFIFLLLFFFLLFSLNNRKKIHQSRHQTEQTLKNQIFQRILIFKLPQNKSLDFVVLIANSQVFVSFSLYICIVTFKLRKNQTPKKSTEQNIVRS